MTNLKIRPGIMDIKPYVGGNAGLPDGQRMINLSANENCLGTSESARAAYVAMIHRLHEYPDGGAVGLRQAIAAETGLEGDRIVCGAGSDELITMLMRAYAGPGDEILQTAHGFLMYAITASTVGAKAVKVPETANLQTDIDSIVAAVTDKTRIVFIANPNNPTGSVMDTAQLAKLRDGLREDILLVVDSAYAEYCQEPGYNAGEALVAAHDNVVMLRTFSKIHGLASLRVGWGYFPPAIVDVMHRIRSPFNVSAPALAAAQAAIRDQDFIARSVAHNTKWRQWLMAKLEEIGLKTWPSQGNFLLVGFDSSKDAAEAYEHLRDDGILVRPVTAYGLPDCLRITIGLEEDMTAVVHSLRCWIGAE